MKRDEKKKNIAGRAAMKRDSMKPSPYVVDRWQLDSKSEEFLPFPFRKAKRNEPEIISPNPARARKLI